MNYTSSKENKKEIGTYIEMICFPFFGAIKIVIEIIHVFLFGLQSRDYDLHDGALLFVPHGLVLNANRKARVGVA